LQSIAYKSYVPAESNKGGAGNRYPTKVELTGALGAGERLPVPTLRKNERMKCLLMHAHWAPGSPKRMKPLPQIGRSSLSAFGWISTVRPRCGHGAVGIPIFVSAFCNLVCIQLHESDAPTLTSQGRTWLLNSILLSYRNVPEGGRLMQPSTSRVKAPGR
jgi:hypothetical protein